MHYFIMAAAILLFATTAHAVDNGQWANSPNRDWYKAQELNPKARVRLGVSWKSCCEKSDVMKTRFRVDRTTADDE
jgi:hypothetical protein